MEPDLRGVMRNFATGVCVATTYTDEPTGRRHDALTVNSLVSLSLDPPLVSISLRNGSGFLAALRTSASWAVSILDVGSYDLAQAFAKDGASRAVTLKTLATRPGPRTGALVLEAPGWLECSLLHEWAAGDHTVVVGEVLTTWTRRRRPPLIFVDGGFHTVESTARH